MVYRLVGSKRVFDDPPAPYMMTIAALEATASSSGKNRKSWKDDIKDRQASQCRHCCASQTTQEYPNDARASREFS